MKKTSEWKLWMKISRLSFLFLVPVSAFALRYFNAESITAVVAGAAFGVTGIFVILFVSSKSGIMTHCTAYCPIGIIADVAGKISPFRIKISDSCTECGACIGACRYGALSKIYIKNRKPGIICSLCGDCISRCRKNSIKYTFFKLKPDTARKLFITIIISLHASFLGLAMI